MMSHLYGPAAKNFTHAVFRQSSLSHLQNDRRNEICLTNCSELIQLPLSVTKLASSNLARSLLKDAM